MLCIVLLLLLGDVSPQPLIHNPDELTTSDVNQLLRDYLLDETKRFLSTFLYNRRQEAENIDVKFDTILFDWDPVDTDTPIQQKGSVDETIEFVKDAPSPPEHCAQNMMIGRYDTNLLHETTTPDMEECCDLTYQIENGPKWTWRQPEPDSPTGTEGTCRIHAEEARPVVTNIMDDLEAFRENQFWFYAQRGELDLPSPSVTGDDTATGDDTSTGDDTHTTISTSDDALLSIPSVVHEHCQRAEMHKELDKDPLGDIGHSFFEQYALIVKRVLVSPEDTSDIDERFDYLFAQISENQLAKAEFVDSFNRAWETSVKNWYWGDLEDWRISSGYYQTIELWDQRIGLYITQLELLLEDPIVKLVSRISQHEKGESSSSGVCVASREGRLAKSWAPYWDLEMSGSDTRWLFDQPGLNSLKIAWTTDFSSISQSDRVRTETSSTARPFFSAVKEGEFTFHKFTSTNMTMNFEMSVDEWTVVDVDPGPWYESTWIEHLRIADITGGLADGYVMCPSNDDRINVIGKGGMLESVVTDIVVARDFRLNISGSFEFVHEIYDFFNTSDCVSAGPFCEGLACATVGTVLLGGDDLMDHGFYREGNQFGWKYIEVAVKSIMKNAYRPTSAPGVLAALGTSPKAFNYWDAGYDPALAILAVAAVLDIDYIFFDGAAEINQFFQDLEDGFLDPAMIWIVGDSAGNDNDLDADEGRALVDNKEILIEYIRSGGGLLSHGAGDITYGWLNDYLPNIREEPTCVYQEARWTDLANIFFPELTDDLIQHGDCHSHFEGDFGPLEVMAVDGTGKPFILGGYGGAFGQTCVKEVGEGEDNISVDLGAYPYIEMSFSGLEFPRILAVHGKRFDQNICEKTMCESHDDCDRPLEYCDDAEHCFKCTKCGQFDDAIDRKCPSCNEESPPAE